MWIPKTTLTIQLNFIKIQLNFIKISLKFIKIPLESRAPWFPHSRQSPGPAPQVFGRPPPGPQRNASHVDFSWIPYLLLGISLSLSIYIYMYMYMYIYNIHTLKVILKWIEYAVFNHILHFSDDFVKLPYSVYCKMPLYFVDTHVYVYWSIYLSTYLSIYPSIYLFMYIHIIHYIHSYMHMVHGN